MRVGSICTGYGGLELGLGVTPEWVAEVDPSASALLAATHPGVPNLGDITAVDWTRVAPVDLLMGGIPCQPVSAAGKRAAEADERWLWPYALDAIKALQPQAFLLENVRNLVGIRKGELFRGICDDLNAAGYDVRWLTIGACHVGLAHHRHRVFLLATRHDNPTTAPTCERVPTTPCGLSAKALPTPLARDGDARRNGAEGTREYWAAREIDRAPLGAIGALLPTPQARDGLGGDRASELGGVRPSGAKRAITPPNAVYHGTGPLLPTPTVALSTGGSVSRSGSRIGEPLLGGIGKLLPSPRASDGAAVQAEHWGRYADAVARHAALYGDPPAPTEPNAKGSPILSPAFAEWLMAIPSGYVVGNVEGRNNALRLIGNGVSPPQAMLAWRLLTAQPEPSQEVETMIEETAPPADYSAGQECP